MARSVYGMIVVFMFCSVGMGTQKKHDQEDELQAFVHALYLADIIKMEIITGQRTRRFEELQIFFNDFREAFGEFYAIHTHLSQGNLRAGWWRRAFSTELAGVLKRYRKLGNLQVQIIRLLHKLKYHNAFIKASEFKNILAVFKRRIKKHWISELDLQKPIAQWHPLANWRNLYDPQTVSAYQKKVFSCPGGLIEG